MVPLVKRILHKRISRHAGDNKKLGQANRNRPHHNLPISDRRLWSPRVATQIHQAVSTSYDSPDLKANTPQSGFLEAIRPLHILFIQRSSYQLLLLLLSGPEIESSSRLLFACPSFLCHPRAHIEENTVLGLNSQFLTGRVPGKRVGSLSPVPHFLIRAALNLKRTHISLRARE